MSVGGRDIRYDYLVIATGYKNDFDVAPGLGPDGNAVTITTLEDAIHAGERWERPSGGSPRRPCRAGRKWRPA